MILLEKEFKFDKSAGYSLSTLCSLLGKYPLIYARRNSPSNICLELAQRLRIHLDKRDKCKSLNTSTSSNIIILDRGFDLSAICIHDLALQVGKVK